MFLPSLKETPMPTLPTLHTIPTPLKAAAAAVALAAAGYGAGQTTLSYHGLIEGLLFVAAIGVVVAVAGIKRAPALQLPDDRVEFSISHSALSSFEQTKELLDAIYGAFSDDEVDVREMYQRSPDGKTLDARFVLSVPRRLERRMNDVLNLKLGDAVVKQLDGRTYAAEAWLSRPAQADGTLPELDGALAARFRFNPERGGGAMPIAVGSDVHDQIQPALSHLVSLPGVQAVELYAQIVAVHEDAKHARTDDARRLMLYGIGAGVARSGARSGARLALFTASSSIRLALSVFLVAAALAIAVCWWAAGLVFWLLATRLLPQFLRSFLLICGFTFGARPTPLWMRVRRCWPRALPLPRLLRRRQETPIAPVAPSDKVEAEKIKDVDGAIKQKAQERQFDTQLVLVAVAQQLTPEIEQAFEDAVSSILFNSQHSRHGQVLAAEPVADPRYAITGQLDRTGEDTFTAAELASLLRLTDGSMGGRYRVDRQAVPNLPVDQRLHAPGPGLVPLGEAAPGSSSPRPVAIRPEDFEGLTNITGNPGAGKSTFMAGRAAPLIALGRRVFVFDVADTDLGDRIINRVEDADPKALDRIIAVNWDSHRTGKSVYFNPMDVRDRADMRFAAQRVDAVLGMIVGDLKTAPRAAAFMKVLRSALMNMNHHAHELAMSQGRDPEQVMKANIAAIRVAMNDLAIQHLVVELEASEEDQELFRNQLWSMPKEEDQRKVFEAMAWRFREAFEDEQIARLLCSPFNRIDFRRWIDEGWSVITAQPASDKATGNMLNAVMYDQLITAAVSRFSDLKNAGVNKADPLHIFVDEAHNLVRVSDQRVADSINEFRKVGVYPVLATQGFSNYDLEGGERTAKAVFRAANWFVFEMPPDRDNKKIAQALDPTGRLVREDTIQAIDKHHCLASVSIKQQDGDKETRQSIPVVAIQPENDPQRDRSEAGDAVWRRGLELVGRPNELGDQERTLAFQKQLIVETLEQLHGANRVRAIRAAFTGEPGETYSVVGGAVDDAELD